MTIIYEHVPISIQVCVCVDDLSMCQCFKLCMFSCVDMCACVGRREGWYAGEREKERNFAYFCAQYTISCFSSIIVTSALLLVTLPKLLKCRKPVHSLRLPPKFAYLNHIQIDKFLPGSWRAQDDRQTLPVQIPRSQTNSSVLRSGPDTLPDFVDSNLQEFTLKIQLQFINVCCHLRSPSLFILVLNDRNLLSLCTSVSTLLTSCQSNFFLFRSRSTLASSILYCLFFYVFFLFLTHLSNSFTIFSLVLFSLPYFYQKAYLH